MAEALLTDEVLQPGLHVCQLGDPAPGDGSRELRVFFDASKAGRQASVTLSGAELGSMGATRVALEAKLQLPPRPPPRQPWSLFSPSGQKLESTEDLLAAAAAAGGVFLVLEGGVYVRPGVRIGHVQQVTAEDGRVLEVVTQSLTPLIFSIKDFLTADDCSHVIEKASGMMFNSPVVTMDKDLGKDAKEWRTSRQAWLESDLTPTISAMTDRVARLVSCPPEYQESLQVLSYGLRQKYDVHLDAFDPQFYQQKPDFLKRIDQGHRNRLATAFWYMTDVEEGGETIFPRFGGSPHPGCNNVDELQAKRVGLLVPPAKGKIIIFYNMLPNGEIDHMSLHGGCPVLKGEKWAANKWIWNQMPM
jgi:prolyl 4-hydroxylase